MGIHSKQSWSLHRFAVRHAVTCLIIAFVSTSILIATLLSSCTGVPLGANKPKPSGEPAPAANPVQSLQALNKSIVELANTQGTMQTTLGHIKIQVDAMKKQLDAIQDQLGTN